MPEAQRIGLNTRPAHPPEILSERTLGELRTALRGHVRQPVSDTDIRRVMRAMCVEARGQELRVEKVILLLKSVWQSLQDAEGLPTSSRNEILDRFITICIEEFFALNQDDLRPMQ